MATVPPTTVQRENLDWDELEKLANKTFDDIIDKVNERREIVLSQIRKEKNVKNEQLFKTIEKVKKTRDFLQDQLNDNIILELQVDTVSRLDERLDSLYKEASKDCLFSCDTKEIHRALTSLGSIEKFPTQYLNKAEPKFAFGKLTDNENPANYLCISVDEFNGVIAATEENTKLVYLYTMNGVCLNKIGKEHLKDPYAVKFINQKEILVSDLTQQNIYKFAINPNNYRQKAELLTSARCKCPFVTCIDYDSNSDLIYATFSLHHLLVIFRNKDLAVADKISGLFKFPQLVVLTIENIFVLDCQNPCVHILSKETKELTKSIISTGIDFNIQFATNFALDTKGNFIFADRKSNNIQIYSPTGQLLHTFSNQGCGRGELESPSAIHVDNEMNIIVCSFNANFPIQIF